MAAQHFCYTFFGSATLLQHFCNTFFGVSCLIINCLVFCNTFFGYKSVKKFFFMGIKKMLCGMFFVNNLIN